MGIRYKFIEKPDNIDNAATVILQDIMPLLEECWAARGEQFYGVPLRFNMAAFASLWTTNGIVVVLAYDEAEPEKPIGLFMGLIVIPMMRDVPAMQCELCYSKRPEVCQGLYNYVRNSVMNIHGIDELITDQDIYDGPTEGFTEINSFRRIRYRRNKD